MGPQGCADMDLTEMEKRVVKEEENWNSTYAHKAAEEYRRFMSLGRYPARLVPGVAIDKIWHAHILFTKQYHEDSMACLGHFFHHQPTTNEEEEVDSESKFDVIDLYEAAYGEFLYPEIWKGPRNDCHCVKCEAPCDRPIG